MAAESDTSQMKNPSAMTTQFVFYDTLLEILPNDELITTCEYNSRFSKKWVYYGDGTSDEMCFAFLRFYPAEAMLEDYCRGWKSITVCAASKKPVIVNGCNAWEFVSFQKPADTALNLNVSANCHLDGHCHEDCESAVMEARNHACLKGGDITDYVINMLQRYKEGLQFLRKLDMCPIKKVDVTVEPPVGSGSRSGVAMPLVIASVLFGLM